MPISHGISFNVLDLSETSSRADFVMNGTFVEPSLGVGSTTGEKYWGTKLSGQLYIHEKNVKDRRSTKLKS